MDLTEDTLLAVAGLAVALIGFSGVVTALGRRGEGKWTPTEMLHLRTLVEPSAITLFGAFIPIVVGLIVGDVDLKWRISNGLLLSAHLVGFSLFLIRGATSELYLSHRIMSAITIFIFCYQLGSIFGLVSSHQVAFSLCLLLGIGVGVHNFYLLLFVMQKEAET